MRIRITHRGKAVATWPDGHVAARTANQLLTEDKIIKVWSPP